MTSALMPFDSLLSDERDANPDLAAAALNPELLQALPRPVRPSLADLDQALSQQKVVVVRLGSGLSWPFIISTATAILLHITLIGSVILLSHLNLADTLGGNGHRGSGDSGTKGRGVVGGFVIGPGEPRPGGRTIDPKPAPAPELVKPIPAPIAPPVPQPVAAPNVKALEEKLTHSEVVGLPTHPVTQKPAETLTIQPPPTAVAPPALAFAPTAKPTAAASPSVASASGTSGGHKQTGGGGVGGAGRGGSRLGQGPGLDDEDAEGYDLMKAGSGGGNGKNRGASGAEKQVQISESTPFVAVQFQLTSRQLSKLTNKRVMLDIQVLADGSVGTIKILESCGDADIDKLFVDAARRCTYLPSIKAGRAITDTIQLSQQFRPD